MNKKRITLIGGGGYVGSSMVRHLTGIGLKVDAPPSSKYDANREDDLRRLVDDLRPEIIINCAGHTGKPNVDACESQKAECIAGNVILPHLIRKVAREKGIVFGQVSSGCIFSGRRASGGGFREIDAPNFSFRHNNCSFYSGTKAMGEEVLGYGEVVRDDGEVHWVNPEPDCYIWRLRIPFASEGSGRNYLTKVMNYSSLLEAENSFSRLGDFARACWQLIENEAPLGIYNVTNRGAIHTSEVVELIQDVGRHKKKATGRNPFPEQFSFFDSEEQFLSSAAVAPRSNCVLDTSKLEEQGIVLPMVEDAMKDALMNWRVDDEALATA